MRPVHRAQPVLPVRAMQTYAIKSPRQTHTRPATCAEARCRAHERGWVTVVPASSPDPKAYTAAYVRWVAAGRGPDRLRRAYAEEQREAGMVAFTFPPGQPCFVATKHRVSLQRPELYLVRGGDWRANTGLIRRHARPEHWVEDMASTMDKVARRA